MQHSESSTAAHLCVNFNATGIVECAAAARFLFGDIRGCAQQRKSRFHLTIRLMQRQNRKAGCDFIGSAVGKKRNAARWCEAAIRDVYYDTALCSAL